MIPALVAVVAVLGTLLYLLLGSAGERKKKLPVTLQDPTVKYPLPLIHKEVGCTQTHTLKVHCVVTPTCVYDK